MKAQITFCIGIRDVSERFESILLKSLKPIREKVLLSVYDMGSCEEETHKQMNSLDGFNYFYQREEANMFSRTRSLNMAAGNSKSNYLFFCDVDIAIPGNFIKEYFQNVCPNKVWFPIVWSQYKDKPVKIGDNSTGWYRKTGFGMMGATKENFNQIKYDETLKYWGLEDQRFFNKSKKKKFQIVRRQSQLVHYWHPKNTDWHLGKGNNK